MKLAVCIQTPEVPKSLPVALLSGSFEDRIQKARNMGLDGLELLTTDPASLDAHAIRTQITQAQLEVAAIGTGGIAFATGLTLLNPQTEVAREAQRRMRDLIEFAAVVGAPVVTIGSFRGRITPVGPDGRSMLVSILREAAAYAQSHNVQLALEPMNRYETDMVITAAEGLEFLEEVGHPALGLLLDSCHMCIDESSWTLPIRQVMEAGRLLHFHLRDNNMLYTGGGLIDFAPIVDTLRDVGYTGYLSAELFAIPDGDTAAQRTVDHMKPLLVA